MSKIFISHSSANNVQALALAEWLRDNGWDEFFLDLNPVRGLAPGERWQETLKAAADRCEVVLFLLSPAWRDSRWCLAEFLLTKQLGKKIFGVLVEPLPLDTLPKEMTAEWQLCDVVAGTTRQTFHVSAEPYVLATQVSLGTAGLERLRIGLQKAGLDPLAFPWPPPLDPGRAPYRGLKALDVEDAAVFFGREAAIVRGLDTLRSLRQRGVERMLVVLGASGAGKSSFLRAGLWPRLARDDRHFLPLPVIRPERAVMSGATGLVVAIESALRQHRRSRTRAEIREAIQSPSSFARLLGDLQARPVPEFDPDLLPPTTVILIDQAEELFAAEGREEADAFLALLGQTIGSASTKEPPETTALQRVIVVFAIRSDSYERLQTEPRLEGIKPSLFDLRPISATEYKAVIEGPAARATAAGRKLVIEPALTERLLHDTEGADAMPLLAFILERLFVEHGGDGYLRLDEYEALGGVRGAIETAIAAAFVEPGCEPVIPREAAEQQQLLHRAFIPWLARVDPDTEERKRRVARWEEIPLESRPLIERLLNQRLLARDRRPIGDNGHETVVIEVAHEALLRQWNTLATWLDEATENLKQAEAVTRASVEWRKNESGEAWLVHTGARLEAAQALQQQSNFARLLGTDAHDYLYACHARDVQARIERDAQTQRDLEAARTLAAETEKRRKAEALRAEEAEARVTEREAAATRIKRRAWVAASIALVAIGFAVASVMLYSQANTQRRIALARQLDTQARVPAEGNTADSIALSTLLAIESVKSADTSEGVTFLGELIGRLSPPPLQSWQAQAGALAFSADGRWLVTVGEAVIVLDTAASKKTVLVPPSEGDLYTAVSFSPENRFLVAGHMVEAHAGQQEALVWDTAQWPGEGQEPIKRLPTEGKVLSVSFSPDGGLLAVGSYPSRAVRIYDTSIWKEVAAVSEEDAGQVVFSADGSWLLTNGKSGIKLWGRKASQFQYQPLAEVKNQGSSRVAVSANAEFLAAGSASGGVQGWHVTRSEDGTVQVAEGKLYGALPSDHGQEIQDVSFSPDNKLRLATLSEDGTVRLWESGTEVWRIVQKARAISFSPDGLLLATGNTDGTVSVWPAREGKETFRLQHGDSVQSVAISSDSRWLATASADGMTRIFEVDTWRELARIKGDGQALGVVFNPKTQWLIIKDQNNTPVRVLNTATWREVKRLEQAGNVTAGFSPDGRWLVTGRGTGTVRLFDTATWQEQHAFDYKYSVDAVSFSPDGKQVVTVAYPTYQNPEPQVWDIDSQREVSVQSNGQEHSAGKSDKKPSTDRSLQTAEGGAVDKAVIDAWPKVEWADLRPNLQSPDNRWQANVAGNQVRLWPLSSLPLITEACTRLSRNWTKEEWGKYFPGEYPPRETCSSELPPLHLMFQGRELARIGQVEEAVTRFRQALKADPSLSFDPETEARRSVVAAKAEKLFQQSQQFLKKEDTQKDAIAVYQNAMIANHEAVAPAGVLPLFDPVPQVREDFFNSICWNGSVRGHAAEVMEACERAVNFNLQNGDWRDSRGLARALTGSLNGAIEDFEFFIGQTTDEAKKAQRQDWVHVLREGKNPFTLEELTKLRTP